VIYELFLKHAGPK